MSIVRNVSQCSSHHNNGQKSCQHVRRLSGQHHLYTGKLAYVSCNFKMLGHYTLAGLQGQVQLCAAALAVMKNYIAQ